MQHKYFGCANCKQVGEEPDAAFGAGAASVGGNRPGSRKATVPRQQGRKQVCCSCREPVQSADPMVNAHAGVRVSSRLQKADALQA